MDSIGKAAFDVDFKAVDNVGDSLSNAYNDIMTDVWGRPDSAKIFFRNVVNYLPDWFIIQFCELLPERSFVKMRANRVVVHKAAKELLTQKQDALDLAKPKIDLMSLLREFCRRSVLTLLTVISAGQRCT